MAEAAQRERIVELGKKIFFDSRLSNDGTVSCATCHIPEKSFSDGLRVAVGVAGKLGTRNTPSLLDVALLPSQFWDGRRATLEQQAADPLLNPIEHGMQTKDAVLAVLRNDPDYSKSMAAVFGVTAQTLAMEHVAQALAAFERTLISGPTPLDRYLYRAEESALSANAVSGLLLFRGRAECASCHLIGPSAAPLTDHQFHGVASDFERIGRRLPEITQAVARADTRTLDGWIVMDADVSSLGRFVVTKNPQDIGKFRTPSLRNVMLTAPYMHDGDVPSLEAAIEFEIYYRGLQRGRPLILTPQERADLLEFLKHLTSETAGAGTPSNVRQDRVIG